MGSDLKMLPAWRLAMWGLAAVMLLTPAIAMQVTDEVQWGPGDFALFGAMLAAVCAGLELTVRLARRTLPRLLIGAGILAAFLLVWAQLAVGIW